MGPSFCIFYAGDAYSTAKKLMGRQSAGKGFMAGVARTWPNGQIHGIGQDRHSAQEMLRQLQSRGFTGQLQWSQLPQLSTANTRGCFYYPAPPTRDLASARNLQNPGAFSFMGVTHTISSTGAMDQIADMVLPPFQSWDALICTSSAAKQMVLSLQEEMRHYWHETTGATRFAQVQLPVIPLGVDVPNYSRDEESKLLGRNALGIATDEVVFLFAGRLSFHAKANPGPTYQALESAAQHHRITCVEAGIFPNDAIRQSYLAAQKALAPSVRFIWVDGKDEAQYNRAWQASDIFVSLSDNIQETFGLTPVEAKAAGLPVIVSDWNGYKDTVRDGIDGFRIPTVTPPAGWGQDLAVRHALGVDTYDFYIGRTSLSTVVDPRALAAAMLRLAADAGLRQQMGQAGRGHAESTFDWPHILQRYEELAAELAHIRSTALERDAAQAQQWPQRADPFHRFAAFPTAQLGGLWVIRVTPDLLRKLEVLVGLSVASYGFDQQVLPVETLRSLAEHLVAQGQTTVNDAMAHMLGHGASAVRAIMWLWKFDLIHVSPNSVSA